MDLDDFKSLNSSVPPEPEEDFNRKFYRIAESFRMNMNMQKRKSLLFVIVLTSLCILHISQLVQNGGITRLGYGLSILGFSLGTFYFFFRYKKFPADTYSLSTKEFLETAEKKLRYLSASDLLIIIPLLLILGTGGGIIFITRLLNYTENFTLLLVIWIIFFISLSLFGFYAGKKNAEKEHGNLLKEIRALKESISK